MISIFNQLKIDKIIHLPSQMVFTYDPSITTNGIIFGFPDLQLWIVVSSTPVYPAYRAAPYLLWQRHIHTLYIFLWGL